MSYRTLKDACQDLEANKMLIQIDEILDPELIIPEIHRRVHSVNGPALLFNNVKGSPFKSVSNLFGSYQRCVFLFRDVLHKLEWLLKIKHDPFLILNQPIKAIQNIPFLTSSIPKIVSSNKLTEVCKISDLPQIKSWPEDGGAFITLPQVISFPPNSQDTKKANIGMYRIQISGNDYKPNEEIGLHYQLHRGIGIHHCQYLNSESEFKISIAIGGPPAYTLASVFPLPENLSEIIFTGLLNNKRYSYKIQNGFIIPQYVDFCITGTVNKTSLKREGPFGDHLGYYSKEHPFPFVENLNIYHKKDAIYPFTVVGRPPQEDSGFGRLIHEMVASVTTSEFPGIREIHAVDISGVHPLLLAIGSERYMPFRERKPEEILTQAFHLLGKGQTSLAKYLIIAAEELDHKLNIYDIPAFLSYILERVIWRKDLHFFTNTTIDTLDYSGQNWNEGSKLVITCNRVKQRDLDHDISKFNDIPLPFSNVNVIQNGIIAIQTPPFNNYNQSETDINRLIDYLKADKFQNFPLIVLTDNSSFLSLNYNNFIWSCFTKSNPSHDIYGTDSSFKNKHWSCGSNLIIDARSKPHHASELLVDPATAKKVDEIIYKIPSLQKLFK